MLKFPSDDSFLAHYRMKNVFNNGFHIFISMYFASKFISVVKNGIHNEIHSHNNKFVLQLVTEHTLSIKMVIECF